MTERRRVYQNAHGVRRTMISDDERPGLIVVKTEQDIEPLLDGVARDREIMAQNGANKLAARIPVAVYERAALEQWDEGDWKKWLNSSDAAPFRIWQGRL